MFQLHERLAADTHNLGRSRLCEILAAGDWKSAAFVHHLSVQELQARAASEAALAAAAGSL